MMIVVTMRMHLYLLLDICRRRHSSLPLFCSAFHTWCRIIISIPIIIKSLLTTGKLPASKFLAPSKSSCACPIFHHGWQIHHHYCCHSHPHNIIVLFFSYLSMRREGARDIFSCLRNTELYREN